MRLSPRSRLTAHLPAPGDVWGGLAAMLVALPSAIAYGIAAFGVAGVDSAGRGVQAGLLGAVVLGLVAPLLGGAPRLVSAPCAPAAAVLAALAAELALDRTGTGPLPPERILVLLSLVALLAGVIQLALGLAGAGRLMKYIPYPVVTGYLSGVGALIFLGQVPRFLGVPPGDSGWTGILAPARWEPAAVAVGLATVGGVVIGPRLTRKVPASILGLAAGVAAYWAIAWFQPALARLEGNRLVIGSLGGGAAGWGEGVAGQLRAIGSVRLPDLLVVLAPAATLAVLLSVDTLKTCVVLDALTRSRHHSNRELIGQGAANLVSAVVGGMPGAGTMGATLVNLESGGGTRASGVFAGGFALLVVLAFEAWLAWIPVAALAGLLLVVAARMIAWRDIGLLRQESTRLDFSVIAAVVATALAFNLLAAAGVGLALATVLFIREQVRGSVIRRKVSGARRLSRHHRLPLEQAILEREGTATTICELQGSLFFGTTDQLFTELEADLRGCRYLVLDWRRVRSVDFTAAHLLEQFEHRLAERGGFLIFSRLPQRLAHGLNLRAYFENVGVMSARAHVRCFESLDEAVAWVEERILAAARPERGPAETPLALEEFDLVRGAGEAAILAAMRASAVERTVAAGEAVFRAGVRSDELFLIRRGVVRITLPLADGTHHTLVSFGRGGFFGEIAFLDAGARSADAIAESPVELYVISRARFDAAAQAQPEAAVQLFAQLARALALRLRRADAEITSLYEA